LKISQLLDITLRNLWVKFMNHLILFPRYDRVVVMNQFLRDFADLWILCGFKKLQADQIACGCPVVS
jgi:hypothetical protein